MSGRGGHRGKSGDNGAGNHRYTPEEREIIDRVRAESAERHRAIAEKQRAAETHRKKLTKLRQRLVEQKVACPGTNVMRLEQGSFRQPLSLTCAHGHTFEMYPQAVVNSRALTLCPTCAKKSHGRPRADARMKYEMRLDEQGMELALFENMTDPCTIIDRETQEDLRVYPRHIDRWQRGAEDRTVRFVADDDDHVFVFRGPVPIVRHPFIREMLLNYPVETVTNAKGKPVIGVQWMQKLIDQCRADGDKVVNLSLNPDWLGEDNYTWGKLPTSAPLGEYLQDMKEEWNDGGP